jgi:hypothetical protein
VLLECLTGEKSYPGSLLESMAAKLALDPDIPGDFGYQWKSILAAMTARDPESRPSAWGVAEALRDLDPALSGSQFIGGPAAAALAVDSAQIPEPTQALDTIQLAESPGDVESTQTYEATKVMPAATSVATEPTQIDPSQPPVRQSANLDAAAKTEAYTPSPGASAEAGSPVAKSLRWTKRRWLFLAVLVVLVIIVAAIWLAIALNARQTGASAPSLPAVNGSLGDHLKQLLKTVTP